MKSTKEQLVNAILFFAKNYNQEKNYKALIESNVGIDKIIQMLVYDMFIKRFNSYYCSDEEYTQYKIILEYATELKEKVL